MQTANIAERDMAMQTASANIAERDMAVQTASLSTNGDMTVQTAQTALANIADSAAGMPEGLGMNVLDAAPSGASKSARVPPTAAEKLISDVVYGLQKDVVKVLLLTAFGFAYRGLRRAASSEYITIVSSAADGHLAGLALALMAGLGALLLAGHYGSSGGGSGSGGGGSSSGDALQFMQRHPRGLVLLVAGAYAVDRLNLLVGARDVLVQFVCAVLPALKRVLTIGRPQSPAGATSRWPPTLFLALPPLALVQQLVHRARLAARLVELEMLRLQAEARKPRARLVKVLRAWQAPAEKSLQVGSAFFGLISALKYLACRGR